MNVLARPIWKPALWSRSRWVSLISILWLALALRLIWVRDAGFTHDVSFFVRWMRIATESGFDQVFAAAKSSYPPLSVYLLGLLGLASSGSALDAPPTPIELLALRTAIIAADLLMIAVLYALGRRIAGPREAAWTALLYAVCPAVLYLSGWWVQIDAWFVLPMVLGAWWLSQKRVVLAWVALGLAIALKLQAIVVLPIFAAGTWHWWGARRLVIGSVALVMTLTAVVAPILFSGHATDLLSKTTQPTRYFQWISVESHNLWFALTQNARHLGEDANRDLNAFVWGISFRDTGLALLALGYALILARLFICSGPNSIFAACAVAWLVFFLLPTRIDARYLFPALPLMLCAGLYQRRWWILYAMVAVTLLVNLVWKSRDISPLIGVLPINLEGATLNAWGNVVVLGLALVFYIAPLSGPAWRQADIEGELGRLEHGWKTVLFGAALLALLAILGAIFWRGRTAGAQVRRFRLPLRASLDAALEDGGAFGQAVVINWPRAILADHSVHLGGIIPVTPPALFLAEPEAINRNATWIQYPPWQQTQDRQIEYHGTFATQAELATLVRGAERVVAFSPQMEQMYLLSEHKPLAGPSACLVDFGQACLVAARTTSSEGLLHIELTWQVTDALSGDVTVFVHIVGSNGNLVAQADGDPAGGLIPLASWSAVNTGPGPDLAKGLFETRLVSLPPGEHRVRVGLYDRRSSERLAARCSPTLVCVDDAFEIEARGH